METLNYGIVSEPCPQTTEETGKTTILGISQDSIDTLNVDRSNTMRHISRLTETTA